MFILHSLTPKPVLLLTYNPCTSLSKKLSSLTFYSSTTTLCEQAANNNSGVDQVCFKDSNTINSHYNDYDSTSHYLLRYKRPKSSANPLYSHYSSTLADLSVIDDLFTEFQNEIDIGLCELEEIRYHNRELMAQEIFESEEHYTLQLQNAIEYFKRPLVKYVQQSPVARYFLTSKPEFTHHDIETVFGNLEELHDISLRLIHNMNERFCMWGPTQLLSDLLLTTLQEMKQPYMEYLKNYSSSMMTLERLCRSSQTKRYVQAHIEATGLGITHLYQLIDQPLYTISRYITFLTKLTHCTDPNHPDAEYLYQCSSYAEQLQISLQDSTSQCLYPNSIFWDCPSILKTPAHSFILRGFLMSNSMKNHVYVVTLPTLKAR
ncbi:Dbl homology domain-containing protein [Spinellus fusiger]|nr:Dbl homology domain-containing protein [Spinellus fusiger]